MTNDPALRELMTKEARIYKCLKTGRRLLVPFEFRNSDFFRHSSLGFRHSFDKVPDEVSDKGKNGFWTSL